MSEGGNRWGFEVAAAYAAMGRRCVDPLGDKFMKPQWDEDGNRVKPGSGKGRLEVYPFVLPQDGVYDELAKLLGHPKDMRRAREAVAHVWAVWEAALDVYGPEGTKIKWSDARLALMLVHACAVGLAVLTEGFGRMIVEEGRWVADGEEGLPEPFSAWDAPEGTEWSLLRSLPGDLALAGGFDLGGEGGLVPLTLKKALEAWSEGRDLTATLAMAAKLPRMPAPELAERLAEPGEPVWTLVRQAVIRGSTNVKAGVFAKAAARRAEAHLDAPRTELLVDLLLGGAARDGALADLVEGRMKLPRTMHTDFIPVADTDYNVTFVAVETPVDGTLTDMADSRLAAASADLRNVMALAGFVFGNLDRIRSEGWQEAYGRLLGLSSKAVGGEWKDVPGWAWKPGSGFNSDLVLSVADRIEAAARAALDMIGKPTEEEGYLERRDALRESAGSLLGAVAATVDSERLRRHEASRKPGNGFKKLFAKGLNPSMFLSKWLDRADAGEVSAEEVHSALPMRIRDGIDALCAERGDVPETPAAKFRRLAEMCLHDDDAWLGETAREAVCRIVEAWSAEDWIRFAGGPGAIPGPDQKRSENYAGWLRLSVGEHRSKAKNSIRALWRGIRDVEKAWSPETSLEFLGLLTERERAVLGLDGLPPSEATKRLVEACNLTFRSPNSSVGKKASAATAEVWLLWGCAEVCSMFGVPIPKPSAPKYTAATAPHRVLADLIRLAAGREGEDDGDGRKKNGKRDEHVVLVKAALDGLGMPSALSGVRWSP